MARGKWIRGKLGPVREMEEPMNIDIRDKVGLEFVEIHIQATIETKRGSDARDDLGNQTVEVSVAWGADTKVFLADVVDGLVINHERTVRVL